MTALENVELPLLYGATIRPGAARAGPGAAPRWASRAGPRTSRASSRAASSSGWRSRARWSTSRGVILADEPTGNLDTRTSVEIMAILQRLNRRGITVVLVTHEDDIAKYASRIVAFRDGHLRSDAPVAAPTDAETVLPTLEEEVAA